MLQQGLVCKYLEHSRFCFHKKKNLILDRGQLINPLTIFPLILWEAFLFHQQQHPHSLKNIRLNNLRYKIFFSIIKPATATLVCSFKTSEYPGKIQNKNWYYLDMYTTYIFSYIFKYIIEIGISNNIYLLYTVIIFWNFSNFW